MYLKYIELHGFKSFANRTKIEFYPGINAIVGPNGCGKSNIVDAIKWAIGEMSWKSLRMPSMMDVIFAGTTRRQPMNLAEVTLVFDNTERKLNFDFNEVAVTRKIYRSEESEYFINRVGCRLKDIREMFLDTGIGTNGYAIIDQGEIDEILMATPEERREVFEEVAGISKYKAKRDETLRKLEKVDYDLSILENSLKIIEDQIKKLELEAKRAKLQQKYREELRESEIAYAVKQILEYQNQIDRENETLSPVLNEYESVNTEVNEIQAELSKNDIELTDKLNQEKDFYEKLSSIKSDIVRTEEGIIKNEELIKELSANLLEMEKDYQRDSDAVERLIPELESKRQRFSELSSTLAEAEKEYEEYVKLYSETETKIKEIDDILKSKEDASNASYQNEINISNHLVKTESELAHIEEDIINVNSERNKISENIKNLESEIENVNRILDELKQNYSRLLLEFEELQKRRNDLNSRIEMLELDVSKNSMQIVSLESRLSTMLKEAENDTYWVGLNEIVNAGIDGVYGSLRSLIKFNPQDRYIIEDVFGEFIDAVVVRDKDTAIKCVNHLKQNGRGRTRFIILENINVSEVNIPDELKQKISYSPEFEKIVKLFLSKVSIDSSEVLSDWWIVGGASSVSSNEPYWGEIDEIKNTVNNLRDVVKKSEEEKENLLGEVENLNLKINEYEDKINNLKVEILNTENKLANLNEKKRISDEELSFINKNFEELKAKETELKQKISDYRQEIEKIRSQSEMTKNEINNVKDERIKYERLLLERKEHLTAKQHNLNSLREEYARIKNEIEELEKNLNELNIRKESYINRKNETENRIANLKNELENLKLKYEELKNDRAEVEIKKEQISGEIERLKNNIARLNANLRENQEIVKEIIDKKQNIELKINTLKTRIEDIILKLSQEYGVNYEEIKEKYKDVDVDLKRIEFLKKRIENMGNVNMAAPEEYDALMKDYNDKKVHIDDLRKAKADLKEAINKINKTTRENFKATFDKVQSYFGSIYTMLFNGGTANLVLTEPDNLLETGIEIMAHPPGKKLVNISQLSGGEKSLTALALLFAFFCVNPSPFCIMDEVDAALDEANVERFVRLLKEFTQNTQFIVITHNKRTMEASDRLYGVTMEELGVSKIISVDLKRAVSMTGKAEVGI